MNSVTRIAAMSRLGIKVDTSDEAELDWSLWEPGSPSACVDMSIPLVSKTNRQHVHAGRDPFGAIAVPALRCGKGRVRRSRARGEVGAVNELVPGERRRARHTNNNLLGARRRLAMISPRTLIGSLLGRMRNNAVHMHRSFGYVLRSLGTKTAKLLSP
jgi:hypothetical protein